MEKLKRRRLLGDALTLGGLLIGVAVLMKPQPFWAHFLEGQTEAPRPSPTPPNPHGTPGAAATPGAPPAGTDPSPKRPVVDVTEAYPSDSDLHRPPQAVTKAYPSDSDLHAPRRQTSSPFPAEGKKQSLLQPLWRRLG